MKYGLKDTGGKEKTLFNHVIRLCSKRLIPLEYGWKWRVTCRLGELRGLLESKDNFLLACDGRLIVYDLFKQKTKSLVLYFSYS